MAPLPPLSPSTAQSGASSFQRCFLGESRGTGASTGGAVRSALSSPSPLSSASSASCFSHSSTSALASSDSVEVPKTKQQQQQPTVATASMLASHPQQQLSSAGSATSSATSIHRLQEYPRQYPQHQLHQQHPPQRHQQQQGAPGNTNTHSSSTSLVKPQPGSCPFVPNSSLPQYIKRQIAAHHSAAQAGTSTGSQANQHHQQQQHHSGAQRAQSTCTSTPGAFSSSTTATSHPNSSFASAAHHRPIVNASSAATTAAAVQQQQQQQQQHHQHHQHQQQQSGNARLRAAAAAASGQHHSLFPTGQQSAVPQQNGVANQPMATSLAAKLQSLKLTNQRFASNKPAPLITPPPSYSASRSSSSGPQSPSLTISSSSTDYSSVPPFIPPGTPYSLFHNLRKPPSPSGVTSANQTVPFHQQQQHAFVPNGTASIVINSSTGQVTAGLATIPTSLVNAASFQQLHNHQQHQHHHQQASSGHLGKPSPLPNLQPSSSRKAVSRSPVIMQSVKSQKISKPILQTAIGPNTTAIKGFASTPTVPAMHHPQQHQQQQHGHHPQQPQQQCAVMPNGGVQRGVAPPTPPSPLYISSSSSNVSFSNVPSPVPSTTSSASRNPPPPYSSVHHHLINPLNGGASGGGVGGVSRAPSSCGSSSSARTSPRTVPPPSDSSSPAYPPPPYSAAIQSVANRLAAGVSSASSVSSGLDSSAPPPPVPPFQLALDTIPAHQQEMINQIILANFANSNPPSLYGGSTGSATSASHQQTQPQHQVPTTEPPSYASSMAAIAAQRAAVAVANTSSSSTPTNGVILAPGNVNVQPNTQQQPPPPAWISNRPLPLPPTSAHQSNLVNTVESICNSQISALQSTNRPVLGRIPAITDSTVPPLPPKPSTGAGAASSVCLSGPAHPPPLPTELSEVTPEISEQALGGSVAGDLANLQPTRSSSPIPQMRRHSKELRGGVGGAAGESSTPVKNYSPAAYKFYMEQHFENLIKNQKAREVRRQQLESEMATAGLSEQAQCEMRRMLRQKESNYIRLRRAKMDRSMFDKIRTIGVGAFGEVALVRKKDVDTLYAMKTLRKVDVFKRNQVAHVKAERDILAEADNEWVVKLYFSFQDETFLYFVMDYIPGGDLMSLLIKKNIFDEHMAQFYIAELVLAVESVHKMGFIHRDIKPDNVLIDREGHIKLTDFGLCTGFRWTHDSKYYHHERVNSMDFDSLGGSNSINCNCSHLTGPGSHGPSKPLERRKHRREHQRCLAHSLVGTPNYIAPEVLMRLGYTQLCDWWSVGVILYEMVVGSPPFYAATPEETQAKVIRWREHLLIPPKARLAHETRRFIAQLCTGAENRLGRNGAEEIKEHAYFKLSLPDGEGKIREPINFESGLRTQKAPFKPKIEHPTDTSNFDAIDPSMLHSATDSDYESEYVNEMVDQFGAELALQRGGPGGGRAFGGGKKKRAIDPSDPKHPQHAFFEFTFRRFFDSAGQVIPIRGCPSTAESVTSGMDTDSVTYGSVTDSSTTTGSQVSSVADLYGVFVNEATNAKGIAGDSSDGSAANGASQSTSTSAPGPIGVISAITS